MRGYRFLWLDKARGLAILAMVIYHAAYDLRVLYQIDLPFFQSPFVELVLHPLFAGLFLFLSGISCRLSQNNRRRGLRLAALAVGISIGSSIFLPEFLISFGILHLMAFCILLFSWIEPFLNHFKPIPAGTAFLSLFVLLRAVLQQASFYWLSSEEGVLGFLLFVLGWPVSGFFSSDYFPLLPWSMAFFAGACLCPIFIKTEPLEQKTSKFSWLGTIGRHTLWVYLLHQPLLLGFFWLVFGQ